MSLALGALAAHCMPDPAHVAHAAVPLLAPRMRGLFHHDLAGRPPTLDLAAWHALSDDGTTHRVGLRPARFHDGTPVRASDVAGSLARLAAASATTNLAGTWRALLGRDGAPVDAITADDAHGEVAIRLAAPFAAFAELLAHPSFGIVRARPDGGVVGCGPLRPVEDGVGAWRFVPHVDEGSARVLRDDLRLQAVETVGGLQRALRSGALDAVVVERQHYPRFEAHASTPLRDRWVGAMMLDAGGSLDPVDARRDFAGLVHHVAAAALPAPAFTRLLLPPELATASYHRDAGARLPAPLPAGEFADRWRHLFAARPLRIVFAPRRGALTQVLKALIRQLAAARVPIEVAPAREPAGVYARLAAGTADVLARGWAQDFDDPEEFLGIYDQQSPFEAARAPVRRLQARVGSLRHAPAHQRLVGCTGALLDIEPLWLCVPFCRDSNRLFHAPDVRVSAHARDTFKALDLGATQGARGG